MPEQPRLRRAVWIGVVFVVAVLVALVYLSTGLGVYRCEACVTFKGRTQCRTASAPTRDGALRTAVETACATLASGVGETIACGQTKPDRVVWNP